MKRTRNGFGGGGFHRFICKRQADPGKLGFDRTLRAAK